MQMRALADHLASVCSFPKLDAIVQRMFSLLTNKPAKGFRAVSLQQLIMADQEMWLTAAQEVGCRQSGDCMFAGRQAAMESIRTPGATAAELQRKGRKRFGPALFNFPYRSRSLPCVPS